MKLFEWYVIKTKDLWLTQEYDDIHNEIIDNTPKLWFAIALDWWIGEERPSRLKIHQDREKDYYSYFYFKFYLTSYQICAILRLKKMPYRTVGEYRAWRIDNV